MPAIRLTPQDQLHWEEAGTAPEPRPLATLHEAFAHDWRKGLFALGACRCVLREWPTFAFWQDYGRHYLTALLHRSNGPETAGIEPPTPVELDSLVLMAPPMTGGEYLSAATLGRIWRELDDWAVEAIATHGTLAAFLAAHAPAWHQVGRVCFHLAENRNDLDLPFAFLATWSTGFGAGGQLRHLPLRQALQQYAGTKNKAALIRLLTPVHEAAKRCDWVGRMVETGQIYQPLAWTPPQAYAFLKAIPVLEEAGLTVRVPDWWKQRPRPRVSVTIGRKPASKLGLDALLDFDARVALGDQRLTKAELKALLAESHDPAGLVFLKGRWVEVDRERLGQAIEHWQRIEAQARDGRITFIEGMRLLAGAPADLREDEATASARAWAHVEAGAALRRILADLRAPGRLPDASIGPKTGIRARLRPYQLEGVRWLDLLTNLGLGACLADDMGLGKTVQVLALLAHGHKRRAGGRRPSLLVVPASLLGNWRDEAERFTPGLKLVFLHPAMTPRETLDAISTSPGEALADCDLAVTTYTMLARQAWLAAPDWHLVILDEAQAIKNPDTRQSRAVRRLKADARIALSGTPVENRLGDLWSLFDFLNPGLLGSAAAFKTFVKAMDARAEDRYAPLRRLVGPYILRRLKTDRSIIADLPEKTETPSYCGLSKLQVRLYEQTVRAMEDTLKKVGNDMARRGLVLQTLMHLKQICNHPSQLTGDGAYPAADSGKFRRLAEICEELAERQEKVLVFTQFREIIEPLSAHLRTVFGQPGLLLHGGTGVKRRRDIVERFQAEDGPPFFILSLKAGGTGLNLTAASHVIHFDRWWNPAVENQATDRAFRIGQKRNVFVHKFITTGTVEERIDALIEEKRELAEQLLSGDGGEVRLTELPDDEILQLVRLDATRAAI